MSRVFGSLGEFAIEADHMRSSGKWIFGHLRFWVGGNCVGDYEDSSDLASSARWGRTFLSASARRTRPAYDSMTTAAVFESLYGRHVQSIRCSLPKLDVVFWDREPYVFDEVGESAIRDKWAIVVVRRGDGWDRMIVGSFVDDTLSETALGVGTCDRVVESYCCWVEGLGAS